MITINTQRLAKGEAQAIKNGSPEEIFEVIKRQYAGQGITMMLLDSGVTSINGEYAIWFKHRMKKSQIMDKVFLTYNMPRKKKPVHRGWLCGSRYVSTGRIAS